MGFDDLVIVSRFGGLDVKWSKSPAKTVQDQTFRDESFNNSHSIKPLSKL